MTTRRYTVGANQLAVPTNSASKILFIDQPFVNAVDPVFEYPHSVGFSITGGIFMHTGCLVSNCFICDNIVEADDDDIGGGTVTLVDNTLYVNHLHSHPPAVGGVEGSAL